MSAVQLVSLAQRLGQESHKLPAGGLRDSGPCGCEGDHCTANIAVVNQSLWEGCENIRFFSLFATGDVSRGGT